MNGLVYAITGDGLQPLLTQDLQLGQRVRQEHRGQEGVIVAETNTGYTVIFPDGSQAGSQRLNELSPFTCIKLLDGIASQSEIAQLHIQAQLKAETDRQTEKQSADQHAVAFAAHVEALTRTYPWAIQRGTVKSEHARAAKNLKTELQQAFPGIKFSVKSSSFAGGDSIDVRWTLGPTVKEVETISSKYQEGDFDGMRDLYENDRSAYGAAVEKILGRTKYVCEQRDYPSELLEQTGRGLCALQHIEYQGQSTPNLLGTNDHHNLQHYVRELLYRTSFKPNDTFAGVERTPDEDRGTGNDWCRIIKTPAPASNSEKAAAN